MKIPDSLKKVISSKVLKKAETGDSKVSGLKELDNLSKNLSFLPNIAKDINIARQNIFKLVKLEGGKPERASNVTAGKEGKSPSPVFKDQAPMKKKEEKEESSFEKGQRFASFFLDLLSPKKILSKLSLGTIFMAAGIITLFKDAFLGLADYLSDAIQKSFTKFVDYIGEWFKEVVKPIFAELTIFMEKIWDNIKDFFKPIFDWVAGKINTVLEFLEPIFNFIGDVFGKIMVYVNKFKETLTSLSDTYNSIQNQISAAKKALTEASGPSSEVQYDEMGNVISDSGAQAAAEQAQKKEAEAAKKKKEEEAAKAAADAARKKKEADDAKAAAAKAAAAKAAAAKAAAPTPSNASQGGRGGSSAAEAIKKNLSPSQLQWLGNADPTDEYIMARMPPPQPGEKGGPPKAPEAVPATAPAAGPAPTPAAKPAAAPAGGGSISDSKAMIIRHEGKAKLVGAGQYRPYKDSKGLWTIGIGHLIGDGKTLPPEYDRVFTEAEIMKMFEEDYAHHAAAAAKVPGFNLLGKAGQDALIDMTFNMGNSWYKKFPKAIQALAKGDFKAAADELTNSEWYKQVKGRAVEIVAIIRNSISPEPVKGGGDTQVAKAETTSPSPAAAAPAAAPTSAKPAAPAVPPISTPSKPISEGSAGGGVTNLKIADFIKFGNESGQKLNWEMLDEKFKQKLLSVLLAFKTAGGKLPVQLASATRTQTDQERIYNTWLAAGGGPDKKTAGGITTPAKPVSMGGKYNAHTGGAAVDFGGAAESIAKAVGGTSGDLSKFGLKWGGTFSKPDEVHIQDAQFPMGGVTAQQAAEKGFDINRTSVSVAAEQREQQKPTTPVVIDASTTNNTQVTKNESGSKKQENTNKKLLERVT
jgi:GH24 family phage-related lysozyme (muramidase)